VGTVTSMHIGTAFVLVWLIIGAIVAGHRGELEGTNSCSSVGTIAATVVAGPLNYAGIDPHISCSARA
jgi:hypothetical protein